MSVDSAEEFPADEDMEGDMDGDMDGDMGGGEDGDYGALADGDGDGDSVDADEEGGGSPGQVVEGTIIEGTAFGGDGVAGNPGTEKNEMQRVEQAMSNRSSVIRISFCLLSITRRETVQCHSDARILMKIGKAVGYGVLLHD